MSDNQLQVILDEQGVAKENAKALLEAFGAPFEEAGEILSTYKTIVVKKEDDFESMAVAREKRLKLKGIRVGVENKRKELKEESLKTGRAIDSVAKFVKENLQPAEEYLQLQEDFAKLAAEKRAAAKKAERFEKLSPLVEDISMYNYQEMTDEQFNTLLTERQAAIKAAKEAAEQAEKARIAAQEEAEARQAAIVEENARLRKEAEAKEIEDAKAKAEQDKKDREAQAERDRIQAEADAKVEAERKKAQALEQEKRDREAADAEAKAKAEEAQRQALLAPDKDKLLNFATMIEELTLPALSSKEAQAVLNNTEELLTKVTTYIRGNVKGL